MPKQPAHQLSPVDPGTALITGASSGLGAAFARHLAQQGYRLVLTGRSVDALAELAAHLESEHDATVETLPADLSVEEDLERVIERLRSTTHPVGFLINNAGIGVAEELHASALDDELAMLHLNVEVPLRLCHAVLPRLLRRGGRILNVASVAALLPRGTYGASKSWLLSFSEWAHTRYRAQGVHVTALCPGPMRTRFHERARISLRRRPTWSFTDVDQVALEGIAACQEGRAVHIPGRAARVLSRVSRLAPAGVVERLARTGLASPTDPTQSTQTPPNSAAERTS
ncbi:MAG: SDR family NAD(P)-dependent oxidoreductase [Micrococcaceae bacterium]